jgi:hypothetical protein
MSWSDEKVQETHQFFKMSLRINELEAKLHQWEEKYTKLAELCASNKCKCLKEKSYPYYLSCTKCGSVITSQYQGKCPVCKA